MDFSFQGNQTTADLVEQFGPNTKVYFALTDKHVKNLLEADGYNENHPCYQHMFNQYVGSFRSMYASIFDRAAFIATLQELGYSLDQVRDILRGWVLHK